MLFRKIRIRKYERGLWFRHGDFAGVLRPGVHRLFDPLYQRDRVEIESMLSGRFEHPMLDVLVEQEPLRSELFVIDNADTERAIVWKDGRVDCLLGAGLFAFWMAPHRIGVERFSIADFQFRHPRLSVILQHPDAIKFLEGVQVDTGADVLLYRDGVLIERLTEGLHVFWKGTGKVRWVTVDRREQVADVAGQEIMTSDKVTLRVNLLVTFQVADAVKAATMVADYTQALYREAQLVLRAAVGAKSLDALLADKEAVGAEVRTALAERAAEIGVSVKSVGLRDIILPGDMKLLLNQVIAAQKEAEANLIRRREETAAARSQANTARLLAENPMLERLKELELLQQILAGAKTTFVFGAGDIADQVRGLVSQPQDKSGDA